MVIAQTRRCEDLNREENNFKMTKTKIIQFDKMTSQNTPEGNVPNFRNSAIFHGFFGIIEYILILITIFAYVSNIALLIASIVIISGLFSVLEYVIIFKNPYYYMSCVGLACITVYPSAVWMIFFIGSSRWSSFYEPFKSFVLFALAIEVLYIFFLISEISHNKYITYFHRTYGRSFRGGTPLTGGAYYSIRDFDKLDKGREFWQDQNPEEIQKKNEELRAYEKRFKK
ncbi:MAG: hypothetical protein KGD66_03375, partial [Candidatus Lokiarchaeota archaeon]|nr:hypothetical protein [Candidatus Lokiarchaeota archaeon]